MSVFPYNPTEIAALRNQMKLYGQMLSPTNAWELLRTTHDRDLAVTALLLKPRPDWVKRIVSDDTN